MPTKKDVEPLATVNGVATFPYSSPFADHVGRFVDSSETKDFLGNPRTFRAKAFAVSRQNGSVYVRLGERFAVYNLQGFFTEKLGSPLTDSATSIASPPRSSTPEKYLQYNDQVDPEDPSQKLWTEVKDGQSRLWEVAADDRGYVYVAYDLWGWLILKDHGGSVDVIRQLTGPEAGSAKFLKAIKTGGKYYVLTGDGTEGVKIWDVTTPASPQFVREMHPGGSSGSYHAVAVSDTHVALVGERNVGTREDPIYEQVFNVYTHAGVVGGQAPVYTKIDPKSAVESYISAASDGQTFYLLWRTRSGDSGIYAAAPAAGGFNGSQLPQLQFPGQSLGGLAYHDGHLTLWGTGIDKYQRGWLFRGQGTSFEERELGDFLTLYYSNPLSGWAVAFKAGPLWEILFVQEGGKDYLVVSSHGLGDVYELEALDRLSAELMPGFGTPNPNAPASQQPFYGDPMTFRSTFAEGTISVSWNFGNPESLDNIVSSTSGSEVVHQYAGLTTASEISTPKTATVTANSDPTNKGTTSVTLGVPQARLLLGGTLDSLTSEAGASNDVVLGGTFVDGSDGSVESHYSVWTQDGTEIQKLPNESVEAGTCGSHTIHLTSRYVPYDVIGGIITPALSSPGHFVVETPQYSYSVKPFVARISASKSGGTITFKNDAIVADNTQFADGAATPWTETWELRDSSGGVITNGLVSATVGSPGTFAVQESLIQPNSKMTLTIKMDPALIVDTGCQTTSAAQSQATMKASPPDPMITVVGCENAGSSCNLTATSVSAQDTSDWTFSWTINGANAGSGSEIAPSITTAGTYKFDVTATSVFGQATATKTITVEEPVCSGAPPAGGISINHHGANTNCTTCATNEPIKFSPKAWGGYQFQECDTFSWNFGDNSPASTEMNPTHTFPGNGPYNVTLTVTNTEGSATANTTIQFGSGDGSGSGTCNAPSGAASPSFTGLTSGCKINGGPCATNETIRFTGGTWQYTVQSCDTFLWEFGDGSTSTQRNPNKAYAQSGTYNVTFTIRNSKGQISQTIQVPVSGSGGDASCSKPPPQPSINYTGASSGCTQSGSTGCLPSEPIKFTADFWQYKVQTCDQFTWNFGDGGTSTEKEPTHSFGPGEHIVTLTVSNQNGQAVGQTTVNTGPPAQAPASASFTTSTTRPKPGEPVSFSATTSGGDPATKWDWNFGDGTTGTGQNVTHTFNGEGSFNVTMTASNSGGSAIASSVVRVTDSLIYVLPVVVHADGQNDSKWRTDVVIHVPEVDPNGIEIEANFRGNVKTILLDSSTKVFEDFLTFFTDEPGAGPVSLSTPAPLQIWTRTYNVSASGVGTLGQLIPVIDMEERSGSMGVPKWHSIGSIRNGDRHRVDFGVVNPNDQRLDLTVHMYDETFGLEVETFNVSVPPFEFQQKKLHQWVPDFDLAGGTYSLRIDNPAGLPMTAYASVVDNISNDPVFVEAIEDSAVMGEAARVQIVPGVGNIGAWRTDLTIFNPDTQAVMMDVTYFDRSGAVNATVPGVVIPGKGSVAVTDVVNSQYIQQPNTAGILQIETRGPNALYPIIFSSTYNDQQAAGTYGHGIPAFSRGEPNVTKERGGIIPGVRQDSRYKTNLGLVALHATETTVVSVELLDPVTGQTRSMREEALAPNASVIINEVISGFLGSVADHGSLRIRVISGGPVWAFATVADQLTKDPEYVPAFPEIE
ncbi:MAG: PKD domain-containing protein [Acidobacteria bacterium]|nr:PKD domain-containing protein [Acidobacteriota bacterium]